jgi:hypothetical protein
VSQLTLTGAGPQGTGSGSLADPSLPAVSTGTLQAHFKTNVGTSTTTDGVAVSQWNDQSGNARHLTQATGTKQPLFKTAIQNGYPAIRCDGTDDFMKVAFTIAQPDTWFFVMRFNAVYAANSVALDGGVTAVSHDVGRTSNTQLVMFITGAVNAPAATTTSFHYGTCQFNNASSFFRLDGVAGSTAAVGAGDAGGVSVGASPDGTGASGIDVCEVVVYSGALNSTDYGAVELYLKNKYGL